MLYVCLPEKSLCHVTPLRLLCHLSSTEWGMAMARLSLDGCDPPTNQRTLPHMSHTYLVEFGVQVVYFISSMPDTYMKRILEQRLTRTPILTL
jgi:hypothetical protein